MQNPRLAARYAKSLLDLAIEQNSLESTLQDVQGMRDTMRDSKEFVSILRSPVIKADKKNAIIEAVIGNRMNPLSKAFVKLLVAKGRESDLPEIANTFIEQYKTLKKIRTVKLITASAVDASVTETIRQKVAASQPDQSIEMTTEVNPALIGGFILQFDNKVVDASVRRDLNDIKKQFLSNLYLPNLR
jgi:F-type H+-transporting ATPase subunit delta